MSHWVSGPGTPTKNVPRAKTVAVPTWIITIDEIAPQLDCTTDSSGATLPLVARSDAHGLHWIEAVLTDLAKLVVLRDPKPTERVWPAVAVLAARDAATKIRNEPLAERDRFFVVVVAADELRELVDNGGELPTLEAGAAVLKFDA
jgi:hypothetical protein